jgi:hypothetical protein
LFALLRRRRIPLLASARLIYACLGAADRQPADHPREPFRLPANRADALVLVPTSHAPDDTWTGTEIEE